MSRDDARQPANKTFINPTTNRRDEDFDTSLRIFDSTRTYSACGLSRVDAVSELNSVSA